MDERIDTLAAMFDKTHDLLTEIDGTEHELATPCADYRVGELLEHLAVWVQVFDGAVNDRPLPFDPSSHRIEAGFGEVFAAAAESILAGLRDRGFDREMTMTEHPMPGEFILSMLLMEYVGHGWDLCRSTGRAVPFTEHEAATALAAASTIIAPEYRGTGMFDAIVEVPADAPAIDRYVGFVGRDPQWTPAG